MKLLVEPSRLLLVTRPTPSVLAVINQLEGRRAWLKGGGLACERTGLNFRVLSGIPGVVVDDQTVVQGEPAGSPLGAGGYVPKTKPYAHQDRAAAKMDLQSVFALFMEQGTGKTKSALDWAGRLFCSGRISGVLVVSKKGAHRQWAEVEIPKHFNAPFISQWWPFKTMLPLTTKRLQFSCFNWDGIKTPRGYKAALEFCQRHKGKLLIIADEAQEMKNISSARWKTLMLLKGLSVNRLLATGTPIAKDLTDEWAQLRWLDENIIGIKYLNSFRNAYCIMGGFEGRSVIGQKNVDHFKKLTEPYVFRATKDELGILPKQYSEWVFDLLPIQKRMIKEMRSALEAELMSGQLITAPSGAVVLNKVQQISSGFVMDEDGKAHRLMPIEDNPRIIAAKEWLDVNPGKVALWIRFKEEAAMLAEFLEAEGISFVQYHGGTSDKERKLSIDSFMSPQGARVFLASPQAAGTGLNLQGLCSSVGYFSNSFSSIDRWQSEDRFHRIGTVGSITYTDFIARGSVDRHILHSLMRKKGLSQMVLDDVRQILKELDNDQEEDHRIVNQADAEAERVFGG
jgi:hypothetical protein